MKKRVSYLFIICILIVVVSISILIISLIEPKNINMKQETLQLSARDIFNVKLNPSLVQEIEFVPSMEQNEKIAGKANAIISKLDNGKITENQVNEISITNETIKSNELNVTKEFDNSKNYEYYKVNTSKYIIHIKTDDEEVSGIYNNDFDYSIQEQGTYETAYKFINQMYASLNLPIEYELCYLGEFDDILWEADFCQVCDGVANPYASVKILFSPVLREISALTVFTEKYDNNDIPVQSVIEDEEITDILFQARYTITR